MNSGKGILSAGIKAWAQHAGSFDPRWQYDLGRKNGNGGTISGMKILRLRRLAPLQLRRDPRFGQMFEFVLFESLKYEEKKC